MLDLVGAAEVAKMLDVEIQRISRWRRDDRLPPVYADLRMSPVWLTADIENYKPHIPVNEHVEGDDQIVRATLMGTAEAADFLKIDKGQINRWRKEDAAIEEGEGKPRRRPPFPQPAAQIAAGPIWLADDIAAFENDVRQQKAEAEQAKVQEIEARAARREQLAATRAAKLAATKAKRAARLADMAERAEARKLAAEARAATKAAKQKETPA